MPTPPLTGLRRRALTMGGGLVLVVATWAGNAAPPPQEPAIALSDEHSADLAAAVERASQAVERQGGLEEAASPTRVTPSGSGGEPTAEPAGDEAAPVDIADEVEVHEPDLVVRADEGLRAVDAEVEGVDHVAEARGLPLRVPAGDLERELDALGVRPEDFRPLTPEVTAQAREVWERLADGDAVVRHDVAHDLGLELGEEIEVAGPDGQATVRVGAFAANGAPPLAEVLLPVDLAGRLGGDAVNALVVAADDPGAVAERLGSLGEVEVREAPEQQRATTQPTGTTRLEPFDYTSRGDGTIQIHGDWVARNIASVQLPGMGTARCHRAMIPQLVAAMNEVHAAGLGEHLDPSQYGGCFVPRHILFNPARSISMHAWGLAIDFNVSTNGYGAQPQMHPGIVEIFKKWGFAWGGDWSTPDGMHFEVERFVQPQ